VRSIKWFRHKLKRIAPLLYREPRSGWKAEIGSQK
jgi:hypothetical protein